MARDFTYQPFQQPHYTSPFIGRIADMMRERGDIQARAALELGRIRGDEAAARGNASAQMAATIGNSIASAAASIPAAIQHNRQLETQTKLSDLALKSAQRQDTDIAAQDEAWKKAIRPDGTIDQDALISHLPGHLVQGTLKYMSDWQKAELEHQELQQKITKNNTDLTASLLNGVKASGYDPQVFSMAVSAAEQKKWITPEEATRMRMGAIEQGPAFVKATTDQFMQQSAEWLKLANETTSANARATSAAKPTEASLAVAAAGGDQGAAKALGLMNPQAPKNLQRDDVYLDGKPAVVLVDPDPNAKQKIYDLQGNPVENAATRVKPVPPASTIVNPQRREDVVEAVKAMKAGMAPPLLPGRASPDYTAMIAEANRQGYDLRKDVQDYEASRRFYQSLQSTQQVRLRQAIEKTGRSLALIDDLSDRWNSQTNVPILNHANLVLAKNGVFGKETASIANQLEGQINDVISELAQVYQGGYSPTDRAMKLAENGLRSDWSNDVLHDMTAMVRRNMRIAQESIYEVRPILPSDPRMQGQPAGVPDLVFERDPKTGKLIQK